MPTYEYECAKCGHKFEEFQGITAKSLAKCPKCKKNALHRLIGAGAGFIFKGSGFYANDYKSASKPDKKEGGSCPAKKDSPSCGNCSLNSEK